MSPSTRGRKAARSQRSRVVVARPEALLASLGVSIDSELLALALTHRSFAHEAGGIPTNERLEFLGDSVLGVVVTEHLFRTHPDLPEGSLAKMRAACVSQRALAGVARGMRLGDYLLLGKGEQATGGRDKDSILSDTLEALIGGAYLTSGMEKVRHAVLRLLAARLEDAANLGAGLDWKTSLQELAASHELGAPAYAVSGSGPDHDPLFSAHVVIGDRTWGEGSGRSKKLAEQEAAHRAFQAISAAYAPAPAAGEIASELA